MDNVIATFTNINDGVTSFVMLHQRGYNVMLMDDDSENFLPTSFIYQDLGQAIEKAKSLV